MFSHIDSGMQVINDFDHTRDATAPQDRLRAIKRAATGFRERFMDQPEVLFYQSLNLVRVPYPT